MKLHEKMRKFSDDDFKEFSGCLSKSPMLCRVGLVIIDNGKKITASIILDFAEIQIEADEFTLYRKMIHKIAAKELINMLLSYPPLKKSYYLSVLNFSEV
jgi:hypothetical protein